MSDAPDEPEAPTRTCYHTSPNGAWYTAASQEPESPMEPGVFLLPAGATWVKPPPIAYPKWPKWLGLSWKLYNRSSWPEGPIPEIP